MTDDKKTVTYEMDVFNPVLSQKLADLTQEFGLGRCHERAPAALEAAPAWMKRYLRVVTGELYSDVGLEPPGHGPHSWLLWVELDADGSFTKIEIVDPSLMEFFMQNDSVVSGIQYVITEDQD